MDSPMENIYIYNLYLYIFSFGSFLFYDTGGITKQEESPARKIPRVKKVVKRGLTISWVKWYYVIKIELSYVFKL